MYAPLALLFVLCAGALAQADQAVTVAGVPATLSTSKPSSGAAVQVANANSALSCQSGQYLTYGIQTKAVPNTTRVKCQQKLGNWTAVAPGKLVKKSGVGAVGATRVWNTTDTSLAETTSNSESLTAVIGPSSGNSNLEQKWTAGKEVYFSKGLTLFTSAHDLTVQSNSQNAVSLQYYINTCASNQQLAYKALTTILTDAVAFWVNACQQ